MTPSRPMVPIAVLAAAFLFNLGQGVLRPSMPLYLERTFAANYRMVTLIPVVFGAGKWIANLPTGYLLSRLGRPLMIGGLVLIALVDIASVKASRYDVFLGLRALGGVGRAMFATVATTAIVSAPEAQRRGRAVSLLLISEPPGCWWAVPQAGGSIKELTYASPFLFEAACMVVAAITLGRCALADDAVPKRQAVHKTSMMEAVLRTPGVFLMGMTNAVLTAIQTGVLVFLFPLYLAKRGALGAELIGLLVSLSVLGRLVALWFGGSVSDRWGRMRALVPGLLIYAVLLGSMSQLTHPAILAGCSLAVGAAAGFVAAIPTALTSDQVDRPLQGVAVGWLRTMSDSGQIAGPLVMGALADAIDLSAPFLFGAALLAVVAWSCRRHANLLPANAVTG